MHSYPRHSKDYFLSFHLIFLPYSSYLKSHSSFHLHPLPVLLIFFFLLSPFSLLYHPILSTISAAAMFPLPFISKSLHLILPSSSSFLFFQCMSCGIMLSGSEGVTELRRQQVSVKWTTLEDGFSTCGVWDIYCKIFSPCV
jgi:hypothetical protein